MSENQSRVITIKLVPGPGEDAQQAAQEFKDMLSKALADASVEAYREGAGVVTIATESPEFTPPTPAQLLLERVLGGLQVIAVEVGTLRADISACSIEQTVQAASIDRSLVNLSFVVETLQDEIIKLDAGQIPESIREAYEALQAHGKGSE